MRNTVKEQKYQAAITKILLEQGYRTMARLFNKFTLILTEDPNCVGYTQFDEAVICLNKGMNDKGFSIVTRHELLHQWLDHHYRMIRHVASKMGLDPDKDVDVLTREIYGDPQRKDNSAADWDLSRYYSEEDIAFSKDINKMFTKPIFDSTKVVKGLILECDHPEWMDLSYEEIYDKLCETEEEIPPMPPQMQDQQGQNGQSGKSGQSGQSGQGGQGNGNDGSQSGENGDGNGGQEGQDQGQGQGQGSGSGQSGEDGDSEGNGSGSGAGQSGDEGQDGQGGSQGGQQGQGGQGGSAGGDHRGPGNVTGSSPRGAGSKGDVQIGNYDPEWQAKEALARAQKVLEEIEKGKQEDKSDEELEQERLERVNDIEKSIKGDADLRSIKSDVNEKKRQQVERRRQMQKARERANHFRGDIDTFKRDIRMFAKNIKDEAAERDKSWSRLDRKNQNPNMMRKGTMNVPSGKIPLVNVYFDWSGSCQPYIKRIKEVLKALQELDEKYNLLRLNIRYFATTLGKDADDTNVGGWSSTQANRQIIADIKEKGAENVIILTDADSDDTYEEDVVVRGAVWWLWSNGSKAPGFMKAVRSRSGKELEYNIH